MKIWVTLVLRFGFVASQDDDKIICWCAVPRKMGTTKQKTESNKAKYRSVFLFFKLFKPDISVK